MQPATAGNAPTRSSPRPASDRQAFDRPGVTGKEIALKHLFLMAAALWLLAGCHAMTLEEARAACTKQGGFLVVLHTQKLTRSGIGDEVASPGDCVSPEKFHAVPRPTEPPSGAANLAGVNAPR